MKKYFLILGLLFQGIFFSCTQQDSPALQVRQLNTSDTFLFEFPQRHGKLDSAFFTDMRLIEKNLGFTPLEKGFDSIQIRLHYGGPMVGDRFVVLTNNGQEWHAEISKINTNVREGYEDSVNVGFWTQYYLTRTIEHTSPKSGWNNFIKKLFKLGVLVLPDQDKIEGFKERFVFDGVGVSVEVATKNVYRLYGYVDPDLYFDKHWQMKNITEVLKLVDEELSLEKMWDYTNETPPDTSQSKPIEIREMTIEDVKPPKKKGRK